ncbi:MAG: type II toxin-antitoxin system RelB/DinJ family antitoxin [Erysipelotrichaceae bacterium]|nr:type II toxin-antitoxin system RelB/DinJ family antitoxin [Erysipelotrichaceae bacterium]
MAATNINIRTDSNLKKKAELIFSSLGLNMSSAVNMFLKAVVRENGIPFELKMDRSASAEILAEAASEPAKKSTASRKPEAGKQTVKKPAARKPAAKKEAAKKKVEQNPANLIDELINSLDD